MGRHREIGTVLVLLLCVAAIAAGAWLKMPNGRPSRFRQAEVISIAPAVRASYDVDPVQAVIALRLEHGEVLTLESPVDCAQGLRKGSRVRLRATPTGIGSNNWQIDRGSCRLPPR